MDMRFTAMFAVGMAILLMTLGGCTNSDSSEITLQTESEAVAVTAVPDETVSVEGNQEETQTEEAQPEETQPHRILPKLREPVDTDFVPVSDYLPDCVTELKYATEDNFTGQVIYSFQDVYLRYGTVKKLMAAGEELAEMGYYLKIWDGFRPISAQFALWEVCPDSTYVANPNKGFSNHSRGYAVDVTLVDGQGQELEMPTGFDDFSPMADRNYSECSQTAGENARLLETVMQKHGFKGYFGEWWHFNDTDAYDVERVFDPSVMAERYPECQEFITLRKAPQLEAEEILKIYPGESFLLLGYAEEFSLVDYDGFRGYVLTQYTKTQP